MKPAGSLLAASNGYFYGLTDIGGKYNLGTLFKYNPFTGEYTKLHDFDGVATGVNPKGSLIEASNGKLYGMTKWGGTRWGTLFEFDLATGVLTKLHDFVDATGTMPCGSLLQATNGKLYGLTSYGGVGNNNGVLFEYDIDAEAYTMKYNFAFADGIRPEGSLIETSPGIFYGLARSGGTGWGTLFEYNLSGNSVTAKYNFDNTTTGREPMGDMFMASNGKIYGMNSRGGNPDRGILFEYDIAGATFSKIHNFQSSTGQNPYGPLMESSDGHLYGMTSGGTNDLDGGTLFRVDTSTNAVTMVIDFDTTSAYKPQYTQLIEVFLHANWTGAVSTDWHNPANWAENDVPSAFTEVVIPDVSGTSGNFPVVSSDVHIRDITIHPGASIDVQPGVNFEAGIEQ
jgi:uncharacterized repeat protein (TIGR03803 family)